MATREITVLPLGPGLGSDVTCLVSADMLCEIRGHKPRYAKVYRIFVAERDRLQSERIAAYCEGINDICEQKFPQKKHIAAIDDVEFDVFLHLIE